MMLEIQGVTKRFGGLLALDRVSLKIAEGQVFGLIGPNGAGKSTLFNVVSHLTACDQGQIEFRGARIGRLGPHEICLKGIGRTFQLVKPFGNISVLKNVIIGAFCRTKDPEKAEQEAVEVLKFLDLHAKKDMLGKNLTIADRKRLELAKALATKPRLLLLDEIMGGLNPKEIEDVIGLVKKIRDSGITIFIIEHVMQAIMRLCERVAVLNYGKKIAEGSPEEIGKNQEVIKAYLGEEYVVGRN
jgi:branched-chain amino acid transport system ATP-binding protein